MQSAVSQNEGMDPHTFRSVVSSWPSCTMILPLMTLMSTGPNAAEQSSRPASGSFIAPAKAAPKSYMIVIVNLGL